MDSGMKNKKKDTRKETKKKFVIKTAESEAEAGRDKVNSSFGAPLITNTTPRIGCWKRKETERLGHDTHYSTFSPGNQSVNK